MAYYVGAFIPHYETNYFNKIHQVRDRECSVRDAKARKMMAELKEQREKEGKPSPRDPVLVCRRMKHLPQPGIY